MMKLLKDLKLYAILKSVPDNSSVPATAGKLRRRIEIKRHRPFSDLKPHLKCKVYDREDVLETALKEVVTEQCCNPISEGNNDDV